MGKIAYFTILLQKQYPIYYSGEMVAGTVNLRVTERLKLNKITMTLAGMARVHWTETRTRHHTVNGKTQTRHETVHYRANEYYLNSVTPFIMKQSNSDLYLEVGDYSYPFQVLLPPNLPTSFEHPYGQIRYSISATIDIPWAFDKHTTRSFSVVGNYDLNLLPPTIRQSYGVSGQKVFCCWCCASEPVTANFEILKGGYVPGEPIVFNASIDNKSDRVLHHMSVKLIQNLSFHATSKTKLSSRNVAQINHHNSAIQPLTQERWDRGQLLIPAVCPSSNGTCRIIGISYSIVFTFGAPNSIDEHLTIPVTIGTIPLRNIDVLNVVLSAPTETPSPPSYEACMFGANPNEELGINFEKGEVVESDSGQFRPMYPVYKDYSI